MLPYFTWLVLKLNLIIQVYLLADEYDSYLNKTLELDETNWGANSYGITFTSFWETVKSRLSSGIRRTFITGISPLTFSSIRSAFNVTEDLSFDRDVAGLCGLTSLDIQASLKMICGSDLKGYQDHLSSMTEYYNGYHFCRESNVVPVYNTESCLAYLHVRIDCLLHLYSLSLSIANRNMIIETSPGKEASS